MQSVDRTEKARASEDIWGYWISEPALLVSPADPAKVERHILNWLRARTGWLYLLWVPNSGATKVGTQAWRQFLNGVSEASTTQSPAGRWKFQIRGIFGTVFADADFADKNTGPIDFHEFSVSRLSDDLAPKILWEVFELGFRYELLAVDRFVYYNSLLMMCDETGVWSECMCTTQVLPANSDRRTRSIVDRFDCRSTDGCQTVILLRCSAASVHVR